MWLMLLLGCPKGAGPAKDPSAAFVSALALGSSLATLASLQAQTDEACLAYGALAMAGSAAAEVLATGGTELPALQLQVGHCVANDDDVHPVEIDALMGAAIDLVIDQAQIVLAVYGAAWQQTDCAAWSAATAAVQYLDAVAGEVLAELGAPNGIVSVVAVPIPTCETP